VQPFSSLAGYFERERANGVSGWNASCALPRRVLRSFHRSRHNVDTGFRLYQNPLLVTYPRSGTNWVRYIVEYVSERPTPGAERLMAGQDFVIDRAHRGFKVMRHYERVMLVIRDYRECLLRHLGDTTWADSEDVSTFLSTNTGAQPPQDFFRNIVAFDRHPGPKAHFHYEELLLSPERVIPAIVAFLQLPEDRLADLLERLDWHKEQSVAAYRTNQKSVTAGDTTRLSHHACEKLTPAQRSEFDGVLREQGPKVYDTYLRRYEYAQE
jgi:hypothetical protein